MRAHRLILVLLALLALTACASLAKPHSFDTRLAYVQAGITAARGTAVDLLRRDRLTVAEAERIQVRADAARAYVDQARHFAAEGKPTDAQGALSLAASILTALEAELRAKGGGT